MKVGELKSAVALRFVHKNEGGYQGRRSRLRRADEIRSSSDLSKSEEWAWNVFVKGAQTAAPLKIYSTGQHDLEGERLNEKVRARSSPWVDLLYEVRRPSKAEDKTMAAVTENFFKKVVVL